MIKSIYKIIAAVVVAIILFTVYQNFKPDYKQTSSTTEVEEDTVSTDTLQFEQVFWQNLQPSKIDTVRDTVVVEKPVPINDSTNRYTNFYSDSTLDATIISEVTAKSRDGIYRGFITDQVFMYSIKRERVNRVENVIETTKLRTITNTKTLTREPKPYFSIGAMVGKHNYGPVLSFNKPNQFNAFYYYDVDNDAHSIGFTIPIKF